MLGQVFIGVWYKQLGFMTKKIRGWRLFFTIKFENPRFHLKKAIFEDQKVTVLGQVTRVCSLAYWRIFRKQLGGRRLFLL